MRQRNEWYFVSKIVLKWPTNRGGNFLSGGDLTSPCLKFNGVIENKKKWRPEKVNIIWHSELIRDVDLKCKNCFFGKCNIEDFNYKNEMSHVKKVHQFSIFCRGVARGLERYIYIETIENYVFVHIKKKFLGFFSWNFDAIL